MRRLTSRFKRMLRRSQTGQAILLLAFGFVVLIGFVGIVTDLSLLFIRYTQLRRAVDSAAVAAAGQFSRTESDVTNKQRTTYAARQFLEFHGVEPDGVVVDTCLPGMEGWKNITDTQIESAPQDPPPENFDADPDNDVDTQDMLEQQRTTAQNVCDEDRKLVQVRASATVPTTFMSLFGQGAVTLTAVAVSETASLDVVIVMDVSESMLFDTTYDDYDRLLFNAGTSDDTGYRIMRYMPPRFQLIYNEYVSQGGTKSEWELRQELLQNYTIQEMMTVTDIDSDGYREPFRFDVDGIQISLEPTRYIIENPGGNPAVVDRGSPESTGVENTAGGVPGSITPLELREECRVSVYPAAVLRSMGGPSEYPYDSSVSILSLTEQFQRLTDAGVPWDDMDMFINTFDFYGCCNDPTVNGSLREVNGEVTGDIVLGSDPEANFGASTEVAGFYDFSDLVCQPFKQARDASLEFLYNIDFLAGDRVAFVTFDRRAHIMDPDGPFDESTGTGAAPAMIEDRETAINVLTRTIGVRAEPTGYHRDGTQEAGGVQLWTHYSAGVDENGDSVPLEFSDRDSDGDDDYLSKNVGLLTSNYLVRLGCEFDNAWLPYEYSLWSTQDQEYGILGTVGSPPFHTDGQWQNRLEEITDDDWWSFFTYENFAGCAGTNFGAALREANNALVDERTIRKDGVVWVIVLLSDGAAGRTDPIPDAPFDPENRPVVDPAKPYERLGASDPPSPADDPAPVGAQYGAYGFCPWGPDPNNTRGFLREGGIVPACADQDPDERHACGTDLDGDPLIKQDQEIDLITQQYIDSSDPECLYEYDADDYARDWADWVALKPDSEGATAQRPTIFTIGFNLEYQTDPSSVDGATNRCEANPVDCVGEELLRYIADVGDNNQQDYDYPNASDGDRFIGVNYGNYWNAPDQEELSEVFDEIASRLFTRLTG